LLMNAFAPHSLKTTKNINLEEVTHKFKTFTTREGSLHVGVYTSHVAKVFILGGILMTMNN